MNSMLLRVVQRTCPSQYLSAISQISRMLVTDIVRVPPQRTVYTLSPDSATVHEHAGFQDFVVQPFAEVLLDDFREERVVFAGANIGDTALHRLFRIVMPEETNAMVILPSL